MKSIQQAQQEERDEILAALWELSDALSTEAGEDWMTIRIKEAQREAKALLEKKKTAAGINLPVAPQLELLG